MQIIHPGEKSLLQARIAATESVLSCMRVKS
jgi:hypothetical protein